MSDTYLTRRQSMKILVVGGAVLAFPQESEANPLLRFVGGLLVSWLGGKLLDWYVEPIIRPYIKPEADPQPTPIATRKKVDLRFGDYAAQVSKTGASAFYNLPVRALQAFKYHGVGADDFLASYGAPTGTYVQRSESSAGVIGQDFGKKFLVVRYLNKTPATMKSYANEAGFASYVVTSGTDADAAKAFIARSITASELKQRSKGVHSLIEDPVGFVSAAK